MKAGWNKRKLSEVCHKITDGTHQTPKYFDTGYVFLSSKNVTSGKVDWDNIKYIDEKQHLAMQKRLSPRIGDVLLAKNGTTGVGAIVDREIEFDIYVSLALLRPLEGILPEYLLYFVNSPLAKSQFNKRLKGAGVPNLHLKEIREVEMPFPTNMEEQKRIVAVLDEAFAALDRARTHAETNLKNARELFESYLDGVFAAAGKGWTNATIEECLKVKSGDFLPKKGMDLEGDIPVVGGNGKTGVHNAANLDGTNIVIGRVGAKCGNVHLLQGPIWLTDNAFRISETKLDFDPEFLAMILRRADLGSTANQAAQPVISYKTIKPVMLSFPTQRSTQSAIVAKANEVQRMTTRLEAQYSEKLADVEDLRQSLLQKAFAGELS